jgi:hypothetical protein
MGARTKRSLSKRASTKRAERAAEVGGRGNEAWYEEEESVGGTNSPKVKEACEKKSAETAATLAARD